MAPTLTTEQPDHDTPSAIEAPPAPASGVEHLETREWLATRISRNVAIFVGVAWYVLFFAAVSLEPEAAHPDVIPVWIGVTVDVVLLGLLAVMAAGLGTRRRWGLVASMGAAGVFLMATIACPASGHHSFGLWWYGQMACSLGLVAISAATLRRA